MTLFELFGTLSKAGESNIRPGEQTWPNKDNPVHLISSENVKEEINLGLLTVFSYIS